MKIMGKTGFALLALLAATTGWGQAIFNKYSPATGIQCNTGSTYFDTACTNTDIQTAAQPGLVLNGATGGNKGPGTVNATALYINGAAVGTSSGAVSSVGLAAPTGWFTVTGSPVTAAGTLTLSMAAGCNSGNWARGDGTCQSIFSASNTQVLYDNSGAISGDSGLEYLGSGVLTVGAQLALGSGATTTSTNPLSVRAGTRGGGNNFIAIQDSTGTKADIGYITSNDDMYLFNVANAALRLGTNNTDMLDFTGGVVQSNVTINAKSAANTQVAAQAGASSNFGQVVAQSFAGTTAALCISDAGSVCGTNAQAGHAVIGGSATNLDIIQTTITAPNLSATGTPWIKWNGQSSATVNGRNTTTLTNASSGAGAAEEMWLQNSADAFAFNILSTAYSGSFLALAPAGETANMWTASVPICIGSHSTCALEISNQTVPSVLVNQQSLPSNCVIFALCVAAQTGAGVSNGLRVFAGTSSSDSIFVLTNAAATTNYLIVGGDGGMTMGAVTDKGPGTINVANGLYVGGVAVGGQGFKFAAVYAFCNSSSCSVNDGYNVSSVTRNSTGNYQVNFTSGFSSTPACTAMGVNNESMGAGALYNTSAVTITMTSGGTSHDDSWFMTCIGS